MAGPSILIVDPDALGARSLAETFASKGAEVHVANDGENGLARFSKLRPDVLVTEILLGGMSGIELAEIVRDRGPQMGVIFVTAHGDLHQVVAAMDADAYYVLGKPADPAVVWSVVEDLWLQTRDIARDIIQDHDARAGLHAGARARADRDDPGEWPLVGRSPVMVELFVKIWRASQHRGDILIEAETGTGKENVARGIHRYSADWAEPFLAANMAAREDMLENELFGHVKGAYTGADTDAPGMLIEARRGMVLLDEIGDAPEKVQRSLLRSLQERRVRPVGGTVPVPFQARIIACTNRPLALAVAEGLFREDTYHRLCKIRLRLPPLRERTSDFPLLVDYYLRRFARLGGIPGIPVLTADALDLLMNYAWPGNVRELANCIERAVLGIRRRRIRPEDLELGEGLGGAGAWGVGFGRGLGREERAGDVDWSRARAELDAASVDGSSAQESPRHPRYERPRDDTQARNRLVAALIQARGIKSAAAKELGMSRPTLYSEVRRLGIRDEDWIGMWE